MHSRRGQLLSFVAFSLSLVNYLPQAPAQEPRLLPDVVYDLDQSAFLGSLPEGQGFVLEVRTKVLRYLELGLHYGEREGERCPQSGTPALEKLEALPVLMAVARSVAEVAPEKKVQSFFFRMPILDISRAYCFAFTPMGKTRGATESAKTEKSLPGPAAGGYTKRSAFYIAVDFGVLMPFFLTNNLTLRSVDIALFLGANFYFDQVDKDIPLDVKGGFLKRFSLTGGFTLTDVNDSKKTVSGVLGGKAFLLGAGYRFTDYLRLGVGALFYRQADPNPLISDTNLRVSPYVSLSLDIDIAGLISKKLAAPKLGR